MQDSKAMARWFTTLALLVLAAPVCAQELERTGVSTIPSAARTRRIEIVIQEDGRHRSLEVAAEAPKSPLSEPVVGTMISSRGAFAVTPTRLLAVGDSADGFRVTAVTLDRVSFVKGVKVHEYDLQSGSWSESDNSHAE